MGRRLLVKHLQRLCVIYVCLQIIAEVEPYFCGLVNPRKTAKCSCYETSGRILCLDLGLQVVPYFPDGEGFWFLDLSNNNIRNATMKTGMEQFTVIDLRANPDIVCETVPKWESILSPCLDQFPTPSTRRPTPTPTRVYSSTARGGDHGDDHPTIPPASTTYPGSSTENGSNIPAFAYFDDGDDDKNNVIVVVELSLTVVIGGMVGICGVVGLLMLSNILRHVKDVLMFE